MGWQGQQQVSCQRFMILEFTAVVFVKLVKSVESADERPEHGLFIVGADFIESLE